MRSWRDQAAPDDPEAWYDVGRMWPTKRGTYETADFSTGTSYAAASAATVLYAFCASTLTGTREYVVDAARIWQFGVGLTDRTGGVTVGSLREIQMAQYGNITICVMGSTVATVSSSGGNFAALAGAPQGNIVCVCSNAVVIFATNASLDGWHASDVGDYTNWTTGESASGRIIDTQGPILAAVPYGGAIYVFKKDAIYRMTYVGGVVKWAVELAWRGLGANGNSYSGAQYQAIATRHGIVFNANTTGNSVYLFDGASAPKLLNPETTLNSSNGVFVYNPIEDVLCIAPAVGSDASGTQAADGTASLYYYYCFITDMWGSGVGSDAEDYEATTTFPQAFPNGVLQGDYYARSETSSKPAYWRFRNITTGAHYRCAPSAPGSSATCYLQTSKVGRADGKTVWDRLTPMLRRRTDLGTDSASLEMELSSEREGAAVTTRTIAESSSRRRFDLLGGAASDCFARFKVTWTALDVEVDDFAPRGKFAGTD